MTGSDKQYETIIILVSRLAPTRLKTYETIQLEASVLTLENQLQTDICPEQLSLNYFNYSRLDKISTSMKMKKG